MFRFSFDPFLFAVAVVLFLTVTFFAFRFRFFGARHTDDLERAPGFVGFFRRLTRFDAGMLLVLVLVFTLVLGFRA